MAWLRISDWNHSFISSLPSTSNLIDSIHFVCLDDDDNSLGNEERTAHTNASSEEVLVKAEPSYEDFAMDEAVDAIWSSELTHNFDHGNSSDLPHVGDDVQRQASKNNSHTHTL